MDYKYDFVHFFLINSPVYNPATEKMLKAHSGMFSHLFVYAHKENFGEPAPDRACDHTIIESVKAIKEYLKQGKYVVLHALEYSNRQLLALDKATAKRVIWCIWGHDVYLSVTPTANANPIYGAIKKMYHAVLSQKKRSVVNSFKGIFVGFNEDGNYLKSKYGNNISIYKAQYPLGYSIEQIDRITKQDDTDKSSDIQVLIGHSSAPYLNHEKVLNNLKPYAGKIDIHLPLSYGCGGTEYAEKIEKLAVSIFGSEHVYVYKELMETEKYIKILNKIDIAIFDMEFQAALGNIFILLYMGKKLYTQLNGIVGKGLSSESVVIYDANDIGKISFEEFAMNNNTKANIDYAYKHLHEKHIASNWNQAFEKILN
ncbi:MAG: TDP-N-acetylfucosamine:lipid II N-acetylfucosaminyltransferase [Acutalibacteraceae bacterium]|nr:TDP-N-acetylfucosamine:lipid II N-acetylfucosaminyltransferase [Acutalibacteraceae bacterium]